MLFNLAIRIKFLKRILKFLQYNSNNFALTGFTLIEILIVFLIGSIVFSIGVNSFTSFNNSQTFNQSVINVVSDLNNTKSRAISQVKPNACGNNTLLGFEIEIQVSQSLYRQNALCGPLRIVLSERKLPNGIYFESGSSNSVIYKIGQGTLNSTKSMAVSGFGNVKTIIINSQGVVSVNSGMLVTPVFTQTPTTIPTNSITSSPSTITGFTRYSDGTFNKSGSTGTNITVFAQGARPITTYNLIAGTNGGNSSTPCSQSITVLNGSGSVSDSTGFIRPTSGNINLSPGVWEICFKEISRASITSPVIFTVSGSSNNSTPTIAQNISPTPQSSFPSNPPSSAAPTSSTTPSTSVRITSITPNPATRSISQSMSFSATVSGINCTPSGSVEFYRNSETTRFTAGVLSNSNPANVTANYNSAAFTTPGTYQIYARFNPASTSCPAENSSKVLLEVN